VKKGWRCTDLQIMGMWGCALGLGLGLGGGSGEGGGGAIHLPAKQRNAEGRVALHSRGRSWLSVDTGGAHPQGIWMGMCYGIGKGWRVDAIQWCAKEGNAASKNGIEVCPLENGS